MTTLRPAPVLSDRERERVERIDKLLASGTESVDDLLKELAEPSWAVRRAVIAALASLGDSGLPKLVEHLRTVRTNETVVAATVDALVASVGDVEGALEPLADERDDAVLADVAQVLGRRGAAEAVPLLIRLSTHANDNVAVAAIEALGRVGGRAAVEPLVNAVSSGNFFRVFPAIDVLGRSGDPRAVAPLAALLDNRQYALEAARALGRTGDRNAVAPLARFLAAQTTADVRVAAMALADLRDRFTLQFGVTAPVDDAVRGAIPARAAALRLGQALTAAEPAERVAIASVLGVLHDESVVPLLTRLLADPAPGVAASAADALRTVGRHYEEALLDAIREGDSGRRKLLLPMVSETGAVIEVQRCLEDGDAEVRAAACDALARIGNPSAVPALFQRLEDPNPGVVQAAVAAIQSLGSPETEILALAAAQSPTASVRRWGLRILSYFGSAAALNICLAALDDEDARVRDAAIYGLPFVDDPRAREALLSKTKDAVPKTRAAAVRALGECPDDARVQSALLRALGDTDPWVRYYAAQSLGRIGAEAAAERIARLLDDDAGQVRVAAVEALSHFKSEIAHQALSRAAASSDGDVRRAALIGLGMARHPEALPTLLEAAAASDKATRLVALAAVAAYDDESATQALATGAQDSDDGIRNAAIGFLAGRPGIGATNLLVQLVRKHPSVVRLHHALSVPSPDRISGVLLSLRSADDELAPLLTSALARMQRPEASAALIQAMSLSHIPARKAAAMTLAGIGTRDALATLRKAAAHDPDGEVRRICSLVLA